MHPSRRRPPDDREPGTYSYEVHLHRAAPDGTVDIVTRNVRAPSLLDAYGRALDDALARAGDPDDPWHDSGFRYPRAVARQMEAADASAPPADEAPPEETPLGAGTDEAPPAADASARSLAEALTARSGDLEEEKEEDGEELSHVYRIRVTGTDPRGRQFTLLWNEWHGRSLLGSYRTVLDGLAAHPEWRGWSFEAQPFSVRDRISEQGPTRGGSPREIPDPDMVAERLGAEPPSAGMSDEELDSLGDTWR